MAQEVAPNSGEDFRHQEKVFVEIGFGLDPAFLTSTAMDDSRKEYFTDTTYIGVDADHRTIAYGKSATRYNQTDHLLSIGFNGGEISELPIPDDSVDEVYLANVFAGTQTMQDLIAARDFKLLEWGIELEETQDPTRKHLLTKMLYPAYKDDPNMPLSILLANMADVKRILKPDGQLTIVENNTPMDLDILLFLLDDLGFEVECVVKQTDDDWRKIDRTYHIQEGEIVDQEPYAIIAKIKS